MQPQHPFQILFEHSYSLQVNFNPFYCLELHQKTNMPWNFHEHVPPLNLRISRAIPGKGKKNEKLAQLFAYVLFFFFYKFQPGKPSKTCCISSRPSTVFKFFPKTWIVGLTTSSCKIYMRKRVQCLWERVIICLLRASHDFHVFNGFHSGKSYLLRTSFSELFCLLLLNIF